MKNMIKIFTTTLMIIAAIMVANPVVSYAAPQEVEPGVWFDAEYYAANNPDVVAVFGTDPGMLYLHYKTYGKNEGRLPMAPTTNTTTTTTTTISGIPAEYADLDGSPCIAVYKYGYGYYGLFEEEVKSYILQMVNNERASRGLNALTLTDDFASYAQVRANELIGNFSHTRPDGTKVPYGEVITIGITGESAYEVACGIITNYKNSPEHWSNLMDPSYKHIGVGELSVINTYNNKIQNYNVIVISRK